MLDLLNFISKIIFYEISYILNFNIYFIYNKKIKFKFKYFIYNKKIKFKFKYFIQNKKN